jgi:hypothetical protein
MHASKTATIDSDDHGRSQLVNQHGQEIARQVPAIDYVFSGPALSSFPAPASPTGRPGSDAAGYHVLTGARQNTMQPLAHQAAPTPRSRG